MCSFETSWIRNLDLPGFEVRHSVCEFWCHLELNLPVEIPEIQATCTILKLISRNRLGHMINGQFMC